MKTKDFMKMGTGNLFRNKGRTALTTLGVVIGCCAVVVMVSIGLGSKKAEEDTLAQMGNLRTISVSASAENAAHKLNDEALTKISALNHVTSVSPRQEASNASMYAGDDKRYKYSDATVVGVDFSKAKDDGYQLISGSWDNLKADQILIGEYFAYAFADSKRPDGKNMVDRYGDLDFDSDSEGTENIKKAYFDPEKMTLTLVFPGASSSTDKNTENADSKSSKNSKDVSMTLKVGGIMKEDMMSAGAFETSSGVLMNINTLKDLMNKQAKVKGTSSDAKKGYTKLTVHVDEMDNVADVEKQIKSLGFQTSSMDSMRQSMEERARQQQMMFGGIGAISLLVAALGIANTMIMSISERTKEIGVMKSLGCYISDIRKLFLFEAGFIGMVGGIIGVGLSYGAAWLMNTLSANGTLSLSSNLSEMMGTAESAKLCIIPWWLGIFAILFSIGIGVAAGYYPAEKAVRIPALEAIKHD